MTWFKNFSFSAFMIGFALVAIFGGFLLNDPFMRIVGDIWLVGALLYGKLEDIEKSFKNNEINNWLYKSTFCIIDNVKFGYVFPNFNR